MARKLKLSEKHREFLAGKHGVGASIAMKILIALGKIFGADTFHPVSSAQISGISYKNISDAGLEFIESIAKDARVSVPSMLNPCGMDLKNWKSMGIDSRFASKQKRIIDAFIRMGAEPTCTCTPYLAGYKPEFGDILAWSESSAVTYVNSVIGARSNREGGPAALASAIVGETPVYGLHLNENRKPQIIVTIKNKLNDPLHYGVVGALLGKFAPGRIPCFQSDFQPSDSGLRALSASLPTYSGVSIFHWRDITPQWREFSRHPVNEKLSIESYEINSFIKENSYRREDFDLIFTGCPHSGIEDLKKIAKLLDGKKIRKKIWICTSRAVYNEAFSRGIVDSIKKSGATLICDTCPVVAPIPSRVRKIITDSVKGFYYMRGVHEIKAYLATTPECIDIATMRSGSIIKKRDK